MSYSRGRGGKRKEGTREGGEGEGRGGYRMKRVKKDDG